MATGDCTVTGQNAWCLDATNTVTTSAIDATSGIGSEQCTLDGSTVPCGVISFGQGQHTVCDTPTDVAGNVGAKVCKTLKLDDVRPTATVGGRCTRNGSDGWCRDATDNLTTSATDATSGIGSEQCTLDGSTVPCGVISVGQGTHTVCDTPTDVAGNVGAQECKTLKLDATPPETSIAVAEPKFEGGALFVHPTTRFALSAVDGTSGVRSTYFAIDDEPTQTYAGPFTLGAPDGFRDVSYWSVDVAGNPEDRHLWKVFVDATPPVVEITRPRPGSLSALGLYFESDSDGDGFADAAEAFLGSDPYDAASRPPLPPRLPECGPIDLPDGSRVEPGCPAPLGIPPIPQVRLATPPAPPDTVAIPCGPIELPGGPRILPHCPDPIATPPALHAPTLPAIVVTRDDTTFRFEVSAYDPTVAGGASGVRVVRFFLNGTPVGEDATAPYSVEIARTDLAAGWHVLRAEAEDNVGNAAEPRNATIFVVPTTMAGVASTVDGATTLVEALLPFLSEPPAPPDVPEPPAVPTAMPYPSAIVLRGAGLNRPQANVPPNMACGPVTWDGVRASITCAPTVPGAFSCSRPSVAVAIQGESDAGVAGAFACSGAPAASCTAAGTGGGAMSQPKACVASGEDLGEEAFPVTCSADVTNARNALRWAVFCLAPTG